MMWLVSALPTMNLSNVVAGRGFALFVSPRHDAPTLKKALMKCDYVKDVSDGGEYIEKLAGVGTHGFFRFRGGDISLYNGFFCKLETSPETLLKFMTSRPTMPGIWASDKGHSGESAEQWIRELYGRIGFALDRWQASV